ncbi:MAG: hypothetical protein R3C11_09660 [Planctomycetaceae bacterium]
MLEGDLLGTPGEPDLLGAPENEGPELIDPESGPLLESPPSPDEDTNSGPVPLGTPPEPEADNSTSSADPILEPVPSFPQIIFPRRKLFWV